MGGSQSTTSSRAAKFSGAARQSVRNTKSAPATDQNSRRATSCRNTNRNVKEFSKFWSDAGSVSRSKSRSSVRKPAGQNGSIRRNRTQSVDVRRPSSQCLSVPPNNATSSSPRGFSTSNQNPRRAASFRNSPNNLTTNSNSAGNSERRLSARSEVYSDEFNQAAIAAARLKRLSLTPTPRNFQNFQNFQHQNSSQIQIQNANRQQHESPKETAIY